MAHARGPITHARGPILDFVRKHFHPTATHICLNKDITCPPHVDRRNLWTSAIWFDGDSLFEGGELVVATPDDGEITFSEKRTCHYYFGLIISSLIDC